MRFESSSGRVPTRAQLKACINRFEKKGNSNHSLDGALLAPLLTYCINKGYAFHLTYFPCGGYHLERTEEYELGTTEELARIERIK